MRKQHELNQGAPEWHQFRSNHGGASEASAMLSLSPYMSRSELLNFKSTGIAKEVDEFTQRIFDKGHAVEALARPIAEGFISDDLYPVTMSYGYLSASCDGLTMDGSIAWECKQFNAKLFESIRSGALPDHHWPQCQQVLLVTGAEKLIFTCSDGTIENSAHITIYPNHERHELLQSSWAQFEKELSEYVQPVIVEAPKVEAIIDLPVVIVQVRGELTLCNIGDMRPVFDKFLKDATVNLITDNDFAQAEAESKIGRDAAKRCFATAKGVVDQTASISEVTRELEQYAAKFNALALSQEKAVKTQKEARKLAIMNAAKIAFTSHCNSLELEIKPIRLISGQPNFPEAMKNKRLLSAIQDAVDSELARVKIEADATAKLIRINLCMIRESDVYKFLFSDLEQIIYKPFDDLQILIKSRIDTHEKAEAEKRETMRLQIEAEATRKAEEEQAATLEQERDAIRQEEANKARAELKAIADSKAEQYRLDREKRQEAEAILNESMAKKRDEIAAANGVVVMSSGDEILTDAEFNDMEERKETNATIFQAPCKTAQEIFNEELLTIARATNVSNGPLVNLNLPWEDQTEDSFYSNDEIEPTVFKTDVEMIEIPLAEYNELLSRSERLFEFETEFA